MGTKHKTAQLQYVQHSSIMQKKYIMQLEIIVCNVTPTHGCVVNYIICMHI